MDTHRIYLPHTRTVVCRGSVHKVNVTNEGFLHYYQRRMEMRDRNYSESIVRKVQRLLEASNGTHEAVPTYGSTKLPNGETVITFDHYEQGAPIHFPLTRDKHALGESGDSPIPRRKTDTDRVLRPRVRHAQSAHVSHDFSNNSKTIKESSAPNELIWQAARAYLAKMTTKRALESCDA